MSSEVECDFCSDLLPYRDAGKMYKTNPAVLLVPTPSGVSTGESNGFWLGCVACQRIIDGHSCCGYHREVRLAVRASQRATAHGRPPGIFSLEAYLVVQQAFWRART